MGERRDGSSRPRTEPKVVASSTERTVLCPVTEERTPPFAPWRACCGQRHLGPLCPDTKVMCCLCLDRFDVEELALAPDDSGLHEDVCKPCAWRDGPSLIIDWLAALSGSSE